MGRVTVNLGRGGRTQQHHAGQVDINNIMAKCRKSGLLPQRGEPGFYGDFTSVEDYMTCMSRVLNAQKAFMTLPAEVRKEFDNSPGALLQFLADENNRQKAEDLGIIPKPEPKLVKVGEPIPPVDPA